MICRPCFIMIFSDQSLSYFARFFLPMAAAAPHPAAAAAAAAGQKGQGHSAGQRECKKLFHEYVSSLILNHGPILSAHRVHMSAPVALL